VPDGEQAADSTSGLFGSAPLTRQYRGKPGQLVDALATSGVPQQRGRQRRRARRCEDLNRLAHRKRVDAKSGGAYQEPG
jgi:hypothetical protein